MYIIQLFNQTLKASHSEDISMPFPPNQLMLGRKHALQVDDEEQERPAKRQSKTPDICHPTPSDEDDIRGLIPH